MIVSNNEYIQQLKKHIYTNTYTNVKYFSPTPPPSEFVYFDLEAANANKYKNTNTTVISIALPTV